MKIPAGESQHYLQSNLSQIHSYYGLKRPKKKIKSNLWDVCFSSTAVVSKLLLGCWGHFLFILCHCNPRAHNLMCMIHMQTQQTVWSVGFHMKHTSGHILCNFLHQYNVISVNGAEINQDAACYSCTGATHESRFLHISLSFSKKMIKIPLENPCTWVTTYSTVKSVTNTFISCPRKTKK